MTLRFMVEIRPGDVLLYNVAIREKGRKELFYGCEVVALIAGGLPQNADGSPITGARAIFRRNGAPANARPGRTLIARHQGDPAEKLRLQGELSQIFGPGELIAGFVCPGTSACGLLRSRS